MKQKRIALVKGDGSAPEMMEVACAKNIPSKQ